MSDEMQNAEDLIRRELGGTRVEERSQPMKCTHCGETRKTWSLWRGFALAPDADVVCCLVDRP